ncbi:MAG: hypothetical protein JXR64_07240 [Spirochaetales bacterium]|nr:hypothetical protein [Spirochaetales bacterium]
MLKKVIIYIFILFNLSSLYSAGYEISDIKINGLKRTKIETVKKIIDLEIGDVVMDGSIPEIKQKLLKSGIFTKNIDIEFNQITDGEIVLIITLEDKWTLIPLPFFSFSNNDLMLGGLFIETNLLGLKQSLVSGGFYSSEGVSFFTAWSPSLYIIDKFSLFVSFADENIEVVNYEGSTISNNKARIISGGFNIGQDMNDYLNLSLRINYENKNDFNSINLTPLITVNNVFIRDYFQSGINFEFYTNHKLNFTNIDFNTQIGGKLEVSEILFSNLIYLYLTSGYSFNKNDYPLSIGEITGSKIVPSLETEFYITSQIKYEIKLFEFNWGYLTLPLYWETGYLENYNNYYTYTGPGFGVLTYINKVAIPALGFNFNYDLITNNYLWGFSFGMSM